MQWCVAIGVGLTDVGPIVHQLTGHSVLACVTGHVKGCVPKRVGIINLKHSGEGDLMRTKLNILEHKSLLLQPEQCCGM